MAAQAVTHECPFGEMRAKLNRFALAILLALAVPASAFASSYQPLAPNAPPPEAARVPIALLTDVGSGQILYASNIDRRFMPASITKVMTAYVAFELLSKGQLTPNQRFRMSDGAFAEWHRKGSTMFIQKGMDITVDELLHGITTVSANDACIVLAEGAAGSVANWVALMNAEARKLGIKVVALLDTDCDPDEVDLPIPGNDDSMRSIELVVRRLTDAILEGKTGIMSALVRGCYDLVPIPDPKLGPRRVDVAAAYNTERYRPMYANKRGVPVFLNRA